MRHLTITPKMVAFYTEKSDRTIRRMCEKGELESDMVGGEWLISSVSVKRKFWRLGKDVWRNVLKDLYGEGTMEFRDAYDEFLEVYSVEKSADESRKNLK